MDIIYGDIELHISILTVLIAAIATVLIQWMR